MHGRIVQVLLALITVFVVTVSGTPAGIDAPSAEDAHAIEALIGVTSAAGLGDPACPCPGDQTQQTCSKGACPTALVLDTSQPAIARNAATYDVVPKRHKTSTPTPEPEPPRPSV